MNAIIKSTAVTGSPLDPEAQLQHWRTQLRALTAAAHRSLDHHPVLAPLVRAPLALHDYVRALRAMHGPHHALELALSDLAQAAKLPGRIVDLDADLAVLGVAPFALQVEPPRLVSATARLGALYVVEGSHLGGQVIARKLAQTLRSDVSQDFFSRSQGRARWERFWQFAGPRLDGQSLATMADAANRTFEFFRAHLDQVRNHDLIHRAGTGAGA